jgi:hypothetical protein
MTGTPDFMLEIPKHPPDVSLFTRATLAPGWRASQAVPENIKSALDRACSPLARRPADKFLECPTERGFRFVAHIMGYSGNLDVRIGEPLGRNLHAPLGEVLDRWTAHHLGKAIGQRRA